MAFDLQRHINDYWFTGHWDVMELSCRERLAQAPGDVEAAFALAESLHGLGRRDDAVALLRGLAETSRDARFPARLAWLLQEAGDLDGGIAQFRRALEIDPATPLARPHLDPLLDVRDRIDDALARQYSGRAPAGGLMLIHPAGAGFWSEVHHVLGHALAAEIDGRRPWVHWGETSFFAEDPARNAWLDFFEPAQSIDPSEIEAAAKRGAFPGAWSAGSPFRDLSARRSATGPVSAADLLARAEPLVVGTHFTGVHLVRHLLPVEHPLAQADTGTILRAIAPAFLRPRAHLAERAAALVARHFGDAPFVAAHLRGTDKRGEQGEHLDAVNRAIGKVADRLLAERDGVRLLLLTDDVDIAARMRDRHGDRVVLSDALRSQGPQSLHIGSGLPARRIGEDVVVDVLAALAADRFVGNRFSNVACIVRALKHWPAGTLHMLGTDDAAYNYSAAVFQRR
jgi:hypothetical protein